MSMLHTKPSGEFCGGTLLVRKVEEQQRLMTLYVNGQPVEPVVPQYGKCIECGTEVLLNPQIPPKQIDVAYEIVKDAPLQIN